MMMHTTLAQLRTLKLDGLATGLEEQLTQPGKAAISFEERVALLVVREVHCRNDRKLLRLLKNAHLKYAQAAIEDVDARSGRGIGRREVMSLALGDWVSAGHSVLITGPTGAGKSWLACALAQHACRRGYSAIYQRVPRLQEELLEALTTHQDVDDAAELPGQSEQIPVDKSIDISAVTAHTIPRPATR
jgi:DNA replication protein DnaC